MRSLSNLSRKKSRLRLAMTAKESSTSMRLSTKYDLMPFLFISSSKSISSLVEVRIDYGSKMKSKDVFRPGFS